MALAVALAGALNLAVGGHAATAAPAHPLSQDALPALEAALPAAAAARPAATDPWPAADDPAVRRKLVRGQDFFLRTGLVGAILVVIAIAARRRHRRRVAWGVLPERRRRGRGSVGD